MYTLFEFILELEEKLNNDRLKLEREQVAIRAAILKRDREKKNEENSPNSNILHTPPHN